MDLLAIIFFAIYVPIYVLLKLMRTLLSLPRTLHTHLIHDGSSVLRDRYHTHGAYALITGSTDGIGRAFAKELASRGWNLILHGRSTERLDPLIKELSAVYPIQTFLPFIADAAGVGAGDLDQLMKPFAGLPITLLINNAGFLLPMLRLPNLSDEQVLASVSVNVTFGVLLLKSCLTGGYLAERACVIVTGSIASRMIGPAIPTYSAAKAYTRSFYACLRSQLACTNTAFVTQYSAGKLEVLSLIVGGVRTKMAPISKEVPSLFMVTPAEFVNAAIGKIGLGGEVYPCFRHEFQVWLSAIWPEEGGIREMVSAALIMPIQARWLEGLAKLSEGARMVDGGLVPGPMSGS